MSAMSANGGGTVMAPAPADEGPVEVSPWLNVSGYSALFTATVRRLLRIPRMVALGLLFLTPSLIVLLVRSQGAGPGSAEFEFALMFMLVPTAVVPFTALVFASGLIQDEVEEQTLTYLLMRPVPRSAIYAVKVVASMLVTALLATVCTVINELVIYSGGEAPAGDFFTHVLQLVALYAATLVAYNAIFALVGLLFRKSLPIGVIYIILFEGVLAAIPFLFRKFTVVYYFRAMARSWFGGNAAIGRDMEGAWSLGSDAPGASNAILTLLSAALVFLALGCYWLTVREMRVKTPETT